MNKMFITAIALLFLSIASISAYADDFDGGISPDEPFALQMQLCNLREGVNINQYDSFVNDYIKWSKKNDVEVTMIRSSSLFTHRNDGSEPKYDFAEFLATDPANLGTGWDKWLSTKEGQRLGERWQELAQCDVKLATARTIWADVEKMNDDNERIALWNWCTRKPGVSVDQLMSRHEASASAYSDGLGNIGWFGIVPRIGGGNAPGDFAHVLVFPDMAGVMEHQHFLNEGGWRGIVDYYTSYADCAGFSAVTETVLHRPGR